MIFVVPVVNLVRFQGSGMNALELRVLQIPEGTQDLEEGAFADCSSLVEAGSERKRRRRRARRFEDEHDRSGVRLASLYQLRLLCHQLDPPKPMELGVRGGPLAPPGSHHANRAASLASSLRRSLSKAVAMGQCAFETVLRAGH